VPNQRAIPVPRTARLDEFKLPAAEFLVFGTVAGFTSEHPAGLNRNPHTGEPCPRGVSGTLIEAGSTTVSLKSGSICRAPTGEKIRLCVI